MSYRSLDVLYYWLEKVRVRQISTVDTNITTPFSRDSEEFIHNESLCCLAVVISADVIWKVLFDGLIRKFFLE